MKRDMDLIRKIVLHMEDAPTGFAPSMEIDGYTAEQIGYHAYLIVDAGLANGTDGTSFDSTGPDYMLNHLTSAGHDFADSARPQFIWDDVIADMRNNGIVSATIDVLKKLLDKKIKKHLEAG